jgi:hypothetical protein
MMAEKTRNVIREGVAALHLIGIVYAAGTLRLTSKRLEWQPFPFFQWFWHLSGMLIRTPVPRPLSIELSQVASVKRGDRLPIGAGPTLKRPLLVTSNGKTHSFYIGVSIVDEADDWFDDLNTIVEATNS